MALFVSPQDTVSSSSMGYMNYQASVIQQLEKSYQTLAAKLEGGEMEARCRKQEETIHRLESDLELAKIRTAMVESKIDALKAVIAKNGKVPSADVLLSFLR